MHKGITSLGHLGLTVRDLDAAVRFYTEVLGLELSESFEYPEEEVGHGTTVAAGAFVRCSPNHHCISIFALKPGIAGEDEPNPPYGLHHIAFELESPERLVELCAHLKENGVEIVGERKGGPGNQPRFYARDPEGNQLEFYWGIDQIGWDGIVREHEPVTEIELADFDFEAHSLKRERDAAAARQVAHPG